MLWRIVILAKAEKDLAWFRKNERQLYVKCFDLIRELGRDPHSGTGKPERLKYFERAVWSRRITHEHRLVYVIYADEQLVEVVSCRSHYEGLTL